MLPDFNEKVYKAYGRVPITTLEGKDAVEEAIKYLEGAKPLIGGLTPLPDEKPGPPKPDEKPDEKPDVKPEPKPVLDSKEDSESTRARPLPWNIPPLRRLSGDVDDKIDWKLTPIIGTATLS